MPYIALKPVRFDRNYLIGEIIPDEVVDPGRAADLQAMKLIAAVPAAAEPEATADPAEPTQGPAGADEGTGNTDTPTAPENGAGEPEATAEPKKKAKAKE